MEAILIVLLVMMLIVVALLVYVIGILDGAVVLRGPGVPEAVAQVKAAEAKSGEPEMVAKPKRLSWAKTRARLEERLTPEEERTLRVREHLGR